MPLVGNSNQSQIELQRTINSLVKRQKKLEDDVERLESLEGRQKSDGLGCCSFEDWITANNVASVRLDVDPELSENLNYKAAQLSIYWRGGVNQAGPINLFMRLNNIAGVRYDYNYKYSIDNVFTAAGFGNQTELFVGRLHNSAAGDSSGKIVIPFYSVPNTVHTLFGDWTAYLFTALPVAQRMEKGEYGGVNGYDFISINRIDLFPAAGNLRSFSAYMYLKCPERTAAGVPPG